LNNDYFVFPLKMKSIFSILFLLVSIPLAAQYNTAKFNLVGSAIPLSDSCFRLTPAIANQGGSVWYKERIDLTENFDIEADIYLGTLDETGADGIAFVLQPLSTDLGLVGGGLGYQGIEPSLAVEYDTWQNDDPIFDHMALVRDGKLNHSREPTFTLSGPTPLLPNVANAEDGQFRSVRITWDAATQTLKCYYDGVLKIEYTGDIVNTIFKGNPYVYWGFTSATGGSWNEHRLCLKNYQVVEQCPTATIISNAPVCIGDTLRLSADKGKEFLWSGPGGFSSTSQNVEFSNADISLAGTYQLILVDAKCQDTATYEVKVVSRPVASPSSNSPLCAGDTLVLSGSGGISYRWSGPNGFSATGQSVEVTGIDERNSGQYELVASNEGCADTSFADVIIRTVPSVGSVDTTIEPGSTITLILPVSADAISYKWSPPDQLSCTTCPDPVAIMAREISYKLAVTNGEGCSSSGDYMIYFTCDKRNIHIPTAFTPNGDNLNDIFYPMGGGVRVVRQFRVFNRFGQMVHERRDFPMNDKRFGWDGTLRGEPQNSGLFAYIMSMECSKGEIIELKGSVTLIR
jgi:gliding motility-associated-like protein